MHMTTNQEIDDRPTIDSVATAIRSIRAAYGIARARNDIAEMRSLARQHDAFMIDYRSRIAAGERQSRELARD